MRPLRRIVGWLQELSIRRKLSLLAGLLAFNILTVISLSIFGLNILSQVRAYVGGEGLWAKAQKNAVYSLSKFVLSGKESDYRDYLSQLKVPLGDRKARMELSKASPDLEASDADFLEGNNHPEDVRGMAHLLLRFHSFGPIHHAIEVWTEADEVMLNLQKLGEDFHRLPASERAKAAVRAGFFKSLDEINDRLTQLENEFSATMGGAARWAKSLLAWAMVIGSLGLGLLSLAIALLVSRKIASDVTRISAAASRAAEGDLSVRAAVGAKDEMGRLAEAFNAMVSGLARIDELKNDFISTISHELRTPLTLNLAPLESLLSGSYGELGERQRGIIGVMHNNALRLLQIVNGLLDFSKFQAGKMELRLEPLDILRLTESIAADFKPAMASKDLSFGIQMDLAKPLLQMDRYLYERILFNLLSNAVKFSQRSGQIGLALRQQGDNLVLEVKDQGIGISAEDARRLFKKFSQAEASSTRRFEGTGLGLALVKECAELLGGSVSLETETGKGSLFRVKLPYLAAPEGAVFTERPEFVHREALPAVPAAERRENSDIDRALPRVLIAEDNPELAAYISSLISPYCNVRLAPDGETALAEAMHWEPALLLTDAMMPKKDGLSLTRELKASAATAAIPVILLTALTSQADLLRGWEAGADDYLFKPFHPRELVARVRSLLNMVAWRRRSEASQRRQEVLEQFAGIASHDLKAPLRRLVSYAELLGRDLKGRLSPDEEESLRAIAKAAAQMNSLVESLIHFSRLDSNTEAFRECDLGEILVKVRKFLEPAIAEHAALIEAGALPVLNAVPEQIFSLFQNLISNSLKYRRPAEAPRITVKAEPLDHAWHFSFSDNGMGFDPVHSEAVFILFRRLGGDTGVPGEGMGLAIAKKIVELHGGRIWAEAEPGRGCAIHFTLLADGAQERRVA
jgi:signal transduction histidine kinase